MSDEDPLHLSASPLPLVMSLIQAGQHERARQWALSTLAARPDDPDAHAALAAALVYTDQSEQAMNPIAELLRRAPDFSFAHQLHGLALTDLGRFAQAELAFLRAVSLAPDDSETHRLYARLLAICDRPKQALAVVELALTLAPDDSGLHTMRGWLLLRVQPKDWTLGEDAARAALTIDPENETSRTILGWVLLRRGERDEAESMFRGVLMQNPGHSWALSGLAELTMARHPLYRPQLWLTMKLFALSPDMALGVVFGAWILMSGSTTFLSSVLPGSPIVGWLQIFYFGLVAWTWFAGPVTYALLRRHHPWLPRP